MPHDRSRSSIPSTLAGTYLYLDAQHRDVRCKHRQRVVFTTDERPVSMRPGLDVVGAGLGESVDNGGLFVGHELRGARHLQVDVPF